jgi:hypothetical protein
MVQFFRRQRGQYVGNCVFAEVVLKSALVLPDNKDFGFDVIHAQAVIQCPVLDDRLSGNDGAL